MYIIEFSKGADKSLRKLPRNIAIKIRDKLLELAKDPLAINNNVKKLVGRQGYRLRIGDWRVIYTLEHDTLIICVITVAARGEVYK